MSFGETFVMGNRQVKNFSDREDFNFAENSGVTPSELHTGTLIFFSNKFSKNPLTRYVRRKRGTLWSSCGVVVNVPKLWPNGPFVVEFSLHHPDDHLIDRVDLCGKDEGVRMVALTDRIQTDMARSEAIGIRALGKGVLFESMILDSQQSATTQAIQKMRDARDNTEDGFAYNMLVACKVVPPSQPELGVNRLAGHKLNYYQTDYHRMQVYLLPKTK